MARQGKVIVREWFISKETGFPKSARLRLICSSTLMNSINYVFKNEFFQLQQVLLAPILKEANLYHSV